MSAAPSIILSSYKVAVFGVFDNDRPFLDISNLQHFECLGVK
jgi:hypothetical protein